LDKIRESGGPATLTAASGTIEPVYGSFDFDEWVQTPLISPYHFVVVVVVEKKREGHCVWQEAIQQHIPIAVPIANLPISKATMRNKPPPTSVINHNPNSKTIGFFQWVNWEHSTVLQYCPDPTRLFSWFVIGFPILRFLMDHNYDVSLVMTGFCLDPYVITCLAAAVMTSYWATTTGGNDNNRRLPLYDQWAAEWYWWNAFLYHGVLDGATGSFGKVPVMLSQYQVLDARFINHHSVPFTVGCVEFFVMQPCCLLLVYAIHRQKASIRFPLELILGCCHIFGLIMFMVTELYEGQLHVPSLDPVGIPGNAWANVQVWNFYHFMYYWFGFWFCNLVWLFIPLIRMYRAFGECRYALEWVQQQQHQQMQTMKKAKE
jgi:hypothetical protein